jgi:predicted ATPase
MDLDDAERRIAEALAPRTELQALITRLFSGGKKVVFADTIEIRTSADRPISLASLSSGEKQALRILIEVVRAGANSILIDEPEISMHVDWQTDLVKSLRQLNPASQLILATHSPEIVAELPDDRLFRL